MVLRGEVARGGEEDEDERWLKEERWQKEERWLEDERRLGMRGG